MLIESSEFCWMIYPNQRNKIFLKGIKLKKRGIFNSLAVIDRKCNCLSHFLGDQNIIISILCFFTNSLSMISISMYFYFFCYVKPSFIINEFSENLFHELIELKPLKKLAFDFLFNGLITFRKIFLLFVWENLKFFSC